MGFSVAWIILLVAPFQLCIDTSAVQRQRDCIPALYCNLVWNKELPCCDEELLPTCGRSQPISSNAKIYGETADLGEFPWVVQIFYQRRNVSDCIGSLISQRFVLSAAHCVAKKSIQLAGKPNFVRLGEHDTSTPVDCVKQGGGANKCADIPVDIKIASYVQHPNYSESSANRHNDLMIFRLERLVQFSDFINAICLPTQPIDVLSGGLNLMVSGWGETRNRTKSRVKLMAMLPVYNFDRCSEFFKKTSGITLNAGQICAGGEEGYDTCRGDSGGPLMYYSAKDDQSIIVGVVSFGAKRCGTKNFPGVYVNVQNYIGWIEEMTKE